MTKDNEKYFIDTYPHIFRDMYGDSKKTCMAYGITCRDGWFALLDSLCREIQSHINLRMNTLTIPYFQSKIKEVPQVVALQVKEKFGELYFYYEGGDQYIGDIVNYTRVLSRQVCEICGKFDNTVQKTNTNWIQSLCPTCKNLPREKE